MSYGGTSLPSLVPNSNYYDAGESKNGEINAFEKNTEDLAKVSFTALDPTCSVKERISRLESTASSQSDYNNLTFEALQSGNSNLQLTDINIRDLIDKTEKGIYNTIAELKAEYDHKFDLQSTENKRLQNTVASLKAEAIQTKRKLHKTQQSLKKLRADFGDPEDDNSADEFETMSITTYSTRPNTST